MPPGEDYHSNRWNDKGLKLCIKVVGIDQGKCPGILPLPEELYMRIKT